MSGERCGSPWGCLVTQEERLQGVGLAPWTLGPEVRPGLVGSFTLGGAQKQMSLGDRKYPFALSTQQSLGESQQLSLSVGH